MIQVFADLQPILRSLTRLGGKLTIPTEFLKSTGDYLLKRAEQGFRTETDPYGQKWAPLSPATIAQKERLGYPRKILTRKGDMRKSPTATIQGKSVKITIAFPSEFHQRGTRKMPKRQILPEGRLSKTDERNIIDLAVDYLEI
ncbi:MAG: phage virion morphogenesis protein [Nostoc sp. NMS7]|uniref:phage virion morphogenesis protein n=1 Tax=Nostoc sp. NMS7 TaxID=2815391 RepID=UPI0025F89AB8|nr:phage virion morphogenesis protein [Nostoc sp. NMS7]MBN3949369.1 phage virion morphogenesis protein [Nostoc sp. NMS7]